MYIESTKLSMTKATSRPPIICAYIQVRNLILQLIHYNYPALGTESAVDYHSSFILGQRESTAKHSQSSSNKSAPKLNNFIA